jgi:hypothetical protein
MPSAAPVEPAPGEDLYMFSAALWQRGAADASDPKINASVPAQQDFHYTV